MRLHEVTNAAEQLELWKLINDTVFNVLSQQAKQADNERAAAQRAQPKSKPALKPIPPPPPAKPAKQPPVANPISVKAPLPAKIQKALPLRPSASKTPIIKNPVKSVPKTTRLNGRPV